MGDLGFAVRNPVNKVVMNIFVYPLYGPVAQLGERLICTQKVACSIRVRSTIVKSLDFYIDGDPSPSLWLVRIK